MSFLKTVWKTSGEPKIFSIGFAFNLKRFLKYFNKSNNYFFLFITYFNIIIKYVDRRDE